MILTPRGAPVDTDRRAELRAALDPQQVVERIDKLVQRDQVRLTDIFSDEDVHQLCDELEIEFRERDFTPAITLGLFVSQCLSRGDACSTVVTKFNRERKRQGPRSPRPRRAARDQKFSSVKISKVENATPKSRQTNQAGARETALLTFVRHAPKP